MTSDRGAALKVEPLLGESRNINKQPCAPGSPMLLHGVKRENEKSDYDNDDNDDDDDDYDGDDNDDDDDDVSGAHAGPDTGIDMSYNLRTACNAEHSWLLKRCLVCALLTGHSMEFNLKRLDSVVEKNHFIIFYTCFQRAQQERK